MSSGPRPDTSPEEPRPKLFVTYHGHQTLNRLALAIIVVSLFAAFPFTSAAQETPNDRSLLRVPVETPSGILYAGADGADLRLLSGTSDRLLISGNGCGMYATPSPDRKSVGIKLISATGSQTPAVINLEDGVLTPLWPECSQVGQVSFTSDGRCAFTVGNEIIITDGRNVDRHSIGSYANLAPISPDGRYVAFNDINDQLWIQELSTGIRTRITNAGYWYPLWAPDGSKLLYLSLDGKLYIHDNYTHQSVALGEGCAPSWAPDSRSVVFSRKVVQRETLLSADLFLASSDGKMPEQITYSDSIMETEPGFTQDGSGLIFRAYNSNRIYRAALPSSSLRLEPARVVATVETHPAADGGRRTREFPAAAPASVTSLTIPYINQVYDTPDWFNGHAACGPTSSMMVLAHYDILPRWDAWCSLPSPGHNSPWGRYICERYYFHGHDYIAAADDPSGTSAMGAYGFMWATGSPHSTMQAYYTNHGLLAELTDSPPYTKAVDEVNAGFPYTICVGLTSAGHIVVALGVGANQGTIVVNDPYGNKNLIDTRGYPNYEGTAVTYDWPGYNNGYQNLSTVYWAVSAHGTLPAAADTLVDDAQLGMGFDLHDAPPASMALWKDLNRGYANHVWYTYTRRGPEDTCYAVWTPELSVDGSYEVLAYIPVSTATAARYLISHAGGIDTVVVNQKLISESWISLGTFQFGAGQGGYVRLGDASENTGQAIVFDALRWSLKSTSSAEASGPILPAGCALLQNYPNPFNPTTNIQFSIVNTQFTILKVYDVLGREVALLVNERKAPGSYTVPFDASGLASGVYFYRLSAAQYVECRKMVLLK